MEYKLIIGDIPGYPVATTSPTYIDNNRKIIVIHNGYDQPLPPGEYRIVKVEDA